MGALAQIYLSLGSFNSRLSLPPSQSVTYGQYCVVGCKSTQYQIIWDRLQTRNILPIRLPYISASLCQLPFPRPLLPTIVSHDASYHHPPLHRLVPPPPSSLSSTAITESIHPTEPTNVSTIDLKPPQGPRRISRILLLRPQRRHLPNPRF